MSRSLDIVHRTVVSGKTHRYRGYVTMDGVAKDLTGDRILIPVWSPHNMNVVFQKDSNQEQIDLTAEGTYNWKIDPTDTADVRRNNYEYEVILEDALSGDRVTLELGELHIKHTPL
jgi:hypothetical protein